MKPIFIPALVVIATTQVIYADETRLLTVNPPVLTQIAGDGTWSGFVHIQAQPCQSQATISANIGFSGAKDSSDAMEKTKPDIEKGEAEAKRIAKECEHH